MSYLNSVTIIGFVGADPEQRQARNNNGSKFTVLSVATQRSWKNTDDEWASKTGSPFELTGNVLSTFALNPLPLGCCLFGYQYRCTLAS